MLLNLMMIKEDQFSPRNSEVIRYEIICHENTSGAYRTQYQIIFGCLFASRTILTFLVLLDSLFYFCYQSDSSLSFSADAIPIDSKKAAQVNRNTSLAPIRYETTFIITMQDTKYFRNSLKSLLTKDNYILGTACLVTILYLRIM